MLERIERVVFEAPPCRQAVVRRDANAGADEYSTLLVDELPALSVAVTVNVCQPGVVSSGDEPSEMVHVAVPEYGSLQLNDGVTVDPGS